MPGGTLYSVVRTLLALLGVCALAWVVLAALARRGIGLGGARLAGHGRLQVLERVTLGPRKQLYLVRADDRTFLVGAADGGSLTLIAELAAERAEQAP